MAEQSMVRNAYSKLMEYIEDNNYKGYDPYDALNAPLFKLPFFKTNKWVRFGAQQALKRFPVNLRPLLFVEKRVNPVTLGLCLQAYSMQWKDNNDQSSIEKKINQLIIQLKSLIPEGFHGACWGYDFDWEARYAKILAYQPTIVATGIISNALFLCYEKTGNKEALELCKSAAQFAIKDLQRTQDQDGNFCFSYSPFDKQVVFNASMKASRLLAQVYSITRDETLKTAADQSVAFVMNFQKENGAWIYSTSNVGSWVDNYHTGYVLDCLDEYIKCTEEKKWEPALEKGLEFYLNNFFEEDGTPKFYDKNVFPIDCTAAAQSLLTLCRFRQTLLANKVAERVIALMQNQKGYFYFRKFKNYSIRTSFMRWSNAWMATGLSTLISENEKH